MNSFTTPSSEKSKQQLFQEQITLYLTTLPLLKLFISFLFVNIYTGIGIQTRIPVVEMATDSSDKLLLC